MSTSSTNILALPVLFNLQMSLKWFLINNVLQMSKEGNLDFLQLDISNPSCKLLEIYDEIVSIDFIVFEMLQFHHNLSLD
jgi:hypothetical protein